MFAIERDQLFNEGRCSARRTRSQQSGDFCLNNTEWSRTLDGTILITIDEDRWGDMDTILSANSGEHFQVISRSVANVIILLNFGVDGQLAQKLLSCEIWRAWCDNNVKDHGVNLVSAQVSSAGVVDVINVLKEQVTDIQER